MFRISTLVALLAAWFTFPAMALNADTKIGVLTCTLSEPTEVVPSEAASAERSRDAICAFRSEDGERETYTGKISGVSITSAEDATVIWVVRSASEGPATTGILERMFSSDFSKPADQKPPLVADGDAGLALHSLSDRPEGAVSTTQKPAPTGFVILRLELKLKSTNV